MGHLLILYLMERLRFILFNNYFTKQTFNIFYKICLSFDHFYPMKLKQYSISLDICCSINERIRYLIFRF